MPPTSARKASSAAGVMVLALCAMVWFLARRGGPPESGVSAGPTTISPAENEALVTERVGTPSAGARDEVPPPPPPPSNAAGVTFGARLMDDRAVPLPGARLAWIEIDAAHGQSERAAAAADRSGVVWLALERADLAGHATVALAASAPERARFVLRLPPERWSTGICNLGEILLPPGGDVDGRVRDADGVPLAGARLALTSAQAIPESERARRRVWDPPEPLGLPGVFPVAWTDADGRFRIEGAPVGRYVLVAETGPARPDGALLPARSEPLEVRAGWTTTASELVLGRPLATDLVAGIVVDEHGAPVAGAEVQLGEDGVAVDTAWTGPDGAFECLALAGARQALRARDPASGASDWSAVQDVEAGATDVVLRLASPPR